MRPRGRLRRGWRRQASGTGSGPSRHWPAWTFAPLLLLPRPADPALPASRLSPELQALLTELRSDAEGARTAAVASASELDADNFAVVYSRLLDLSARLGLHAVTRVPQRAGHRRAERVCPRAVPRHARGAPAAQRSAIDPDGPKGGVRQRPQRPVIKGAFDVWVLEPTLKTAVELAPAPSEGEEVMGTFKDYTGATGGGWTRVKRMATQIAKDGPTRDRVARYVEGYVAALGGATEAAQTSRAASRTAAGIGAFLGNVSENGLDQALRDVGLEGAIGRPGIEIVDAGGRAGRGRRDARGQRSEAGSLDCLDPELGDLTWDELEQRAFGDDDVRSFLAVFLGRYVFRRVLALMMTRLNRKPVNVRRRTEQELDDYTRACGVNIVREVDLHSFGAGNRVRPSGGTCAAHVRGVRIMTTLRLRTRSGERAPNGGTILLDAFAGADRLASTVYSGDRSERRTRNPANLAAPANDLMWLSIAVLGADVTIPRSRTADGWTRQIDLEIGLEDERWAGVRPDLEGLLGFLTGDQWRVASSPMHRVDCRSRARPATWCASRAAWLLGRATFWLAIRTGEWCLWERGTRAPAPASRSTSARTSSPRSRGA